MALCRLSDDLVIEDRNVLYTREKADGSVVVMFAGPGAETEHRLELHGAEAEAEAMRRHLANASVPRGGHAA